MPVPVPDATTFLLWSVTVTVQCKALESLAWKTIGPPSFPCTEGAYSFGNPAAATSEVILGSCR